MPSAKKHFSHFSSLLPNNPSANLANSYLQNIFKIPSLIAISIATALNQVPATSHLGCGGLSPLFPCQRALSAQQPARGIFLKHETDEIHLLPKSLQRCRWAETHTQQDQSSCTWYVFCQFLRWTTCLSPVHPPTSLAFFPSFQHTHSWHWPCSLLFLLHRVFFPQISHDNPLPLIWVPALESPPKNDFHWPFELKHLPPSPSRSSTISHHPILLFLKHLHYVVKCYFIFTICCLPLPPRT